MITAEKNGSTAKYHVPAAPNQLQEAFHYPTTAKKKAHNTAPRVISNSPMTSSHSLLDNSEEPRVNNQMRIMNSQIYYLHPGDILSQLILPSKHKYSAYTPTPNNQCQKSASKQVLDMYGFLHNKLYVNLLPC
jgi:hypothetical protein